MQANAGGVMIWDVTQDYYTATQQQDGTFGDSVHSLMPAVRRGLGLGITNPNITNTGPASGDSNTARILGHVFFDGDRNGVENGYDYGHSGRVVFLDTNNNGVLDAGEISTTTNDNGDYEFDLLPAGNYHVRLEPKSWLFSTTAISQPTTCGVDQDVFNVDFGEWVTYR